MGEEMGKEREMSALQFVPFPQPRGQRSRVRGSSISPSSGGSTGPQHTASLGPSPQHPHIMMGRG